MILQNLFTKIAKHQLGAATTLEYTAPADKGASGIKFGTQGRGVFSCSLEKFYNNGPNFYFQGINATIRCISVQWWTEVSFEALIGKEKCFFFHHMHSVLSNGEVNALSSRREDGSTSKTIAPLLFHS
jgi:hypothetical protein